MRGGQNMIRFVNKEGVEKFTIQDNGDIDFATKEEKRKFDKAELELTEGESRDDKEGENA